MPIGPIARALLGLALPGLGQVALGQRFRGLWFLMGVGILFLTGALVSGGVVSGHPGFWPWWKEYASLPASATSPLGGVVSDLLHLFMLAYPVFTGLGCFGVGLVVGIPSLHLGGDGAMEQDVAFSLLVGAALLNLLVVIDAVDHARRSTAPEEASPQGGTEGSPPS